MSFTERCHQHHATINSWIKKHPWFNMLAVAVLATTMFFCFRYLIAVLLVVFPMLYLYIIVVMIGDSIWKSNTGFYEKHRCKECGRFIEPN